MSTTTAGQYDIIADQDATFGLTATWRDSNGAAVNLTGYSALMQLRTRTASTTVDLTLSTANGRITLGGAAGTITMLVAATDMTLSGNYVYDLKLTSGVTVTTLLTGDFTVRPAITR